MEYLTESRHSEDFPVSAVELGNRAGDSRDSGREGCGRSVLKEKGLTVTVSKSETAGSQTQKGVQRVDRLLSGP